MKQDRLRWHGWMQVAGLAAILFLAVAALSAVPVVRQSQLRLTDTYFRIVPPPPGASPVVLVLIDDESLRKYGRWPWSRELLAQLTRNLSQARAAIVGFDILLSEPQSAQTDNLLRDTFANMRRAILVDKIATYPDGPRWVEPLPKFAGSAAGVGHALAVLDLDGVCRHFPARELTTDGTRWSFAVEAARWVDPQRTSEFLDNYGMSLNDTEDAVVRISPALVPIAFRRDGFEKLSASAVLDRRGIDIVRGRPVLVGFGPAELSDRVSTPLTSELPVPGVEVHAHILDSILNGRHLHTVPLRISAPLLLLLCISLIIVFRWMRGWATVLLLFSAAACVYLAGLVSFTVASSVLSIGPAMLAVFLAPLVTSTSDFVLVERSLTRQLQDMRYWLAGRNEVLARDTDDLSWRLKLLRTMQTQLGSLYELYDTLLEATADAVATFDSHGNLLLKNRRFSALFKPPYDTGITLESVWNWLAPNNGGIPIQRGQTIEGEAYIGDDLYSVRVIPLPPTTVSPGGGTILMMTSLKARVERDRARAESLGFITHELRTPLSAIQGFAQLMMEYPGSPSCEKAPHTIYRESKRLLALIHSYLDLLRLDAGARPVRAERVDLKEIVSQVFDILQPMAIASKVSLVSELRESIAVTGDAPLINGAVLNLVSNAIKYGKTETDVRVRCFWAGQYVVLSVQNVGEALAPDEASRLFDPYYRSSAAEANKPGWGLGLAFVKRIAEKHGGLVQVSTDVSGTTFAIHLPVASASAATNRNS